MISAGNELIALGNAPGRQQATAFGEQFILSHMPPCRPVIAMRSYGSPTNRRIRRRERGLLPVAD